MNQSGRDDIPAIDLYLDGLLDTEARARFERMLAADADLAAAVERQRRIDGALGRAFQPPSADTALRMLPHEVAPTQRNIRPVWRQRFAAAAAIAIFAVGLKLIWSEYAPAPVLPPRAMPTFDQVYDRQVATGFKPYWTCDSDTQFADTFRTRLGQPLLAQAPQGITTWGLAYADAITARSILVLAELKGTRSIVIIDRAANDTKPRPPLNSGLHLFNRRIGQLTLYEITPAASATLLDRFTQPAPATNLNRCPITDSQPR